MRTYTNADLADIIDDEGAGYAITDYVSVERITDLETRALWIAAERAIGAVCQRCFRARAALEDALSEPQT